MAARRMEAGDGLGLTPQQERLAVEAAQQMLSTRGGRRIAVILLVCAVLIAAGWWLAEHRQAQHALSTGPTVRVATWNMHVFAPRPEIHLDTIAQIIRSSNFDVVALQEIRENGQEVDALLDTLGAPWKRTAFSPITGNHERFVFIFNSQHVAETGPAHAINSPDSLAFNRIPFEDSFTAGNFSFTLITCHLYYGDNTKGHQRRRHEAQLLADFAEREESTHTGMNVIVLGDFNETIGLENLNFFINDGWEELNHNPTNLHSSQVYDNLLIDPRRLNEWTGTSGSIHFDESEFHRDDKTAVEEVSDHRPAFADFLTTLHATGAGQ